MRTLALLAALIVASPIVFTTAQSRTHHHHAILLEGGYYTNVSGHRVHRPSHTVGNVAPSGASARCTDGSYSFSEHHRGTCSHHGGVDQWL